MCVMLKQGLKPAHPGQILRTLFLEPLQLGQEEVASNLGITRKTLSMLINGRQGVSAEMALRLSKAFKTNPELWLNLQRNCDLWEASQKIHLSKIQPFKGVKSLSNNPLLTKFA